jgi:hypothetical protein
MRIAASILTFCASATRALKAENGVYSADALKLVCHALYLRCSHTGHDDNGQASTVHSYSRARTVSRWVKLSRIIGSTMDLVSFAEIGGMTHQFLIQQLRLYS